MYNHSGQSGTKSNGNEGVLHSLLTPRLEPHYYVFLLPCALYVFLCLCVCVDAKLNKYVSGKSVYLNVYPYVSLLVDEAMFSPCECSQTLSLFLSFSLTLTHYR